MSNLSNWRLVNRWRSLRRRELWFVTDGAGWAFDWVAFHIAEGARSRGLGARVAQSALGTRGQIIHYVDRYAYLHRELESIHSSNKVFLTWFHGSLQSREGDFAPMLEILRDRAIHRLERVVVSCGASRAGLVEAGIPEDRIVLIPIGVDRQLFTPRDSETQRQARHLLGLDDDALWVGSFQKDGQGWGDGETPKLIKGPDVFLDVVERLQGRFPNLRVLLTGPSRAFVRRGLEERGIPYVHRRLEDFRDVPVCYHALDLYLITSREEGGPKALLEAWATGVPIVSTCMGMPADHIKDGVNGRLADVDDVDGISQAAEDLLADETLRRRCVAAGLEAVELLDWGRIAARYYDELYRPILDPDGAATGAVNGA